MATDTCPGGLVTITPGLTPIVLTGTTKGATDNYTEFCADAGPQLAAPDVVWELDVSSTCSADISLNEAAGFDGALSIRETVCDSRSGGDTCVNQHTHGESTKLELKAGKHYLVVDGANKTSGDFSVTITCTDPACGDGVLNSAEEQCEPVSTTDPNCGQPGTANACKVLESMSSDTCPGTVINLGATMDTAIPAMPPQFNTVGTVDNYSDPHCGAAGAGDEVFQIVPQITGKLTVMIGRSAAGNFTEVYGSNHDACQPPEYSSIDCWTHNIYLRSSCDNNPASTISPAGCNPGTPVFGQPPVVSECGWQCADPGNDNGVNIISADVTAGVPVWLFVDGQGPSAPQSPTEGAYTLHFKLQ
jgi:hypothetical protein